MKPNNTDQMDVYIKKLVSNSKAIISHQKAIPLGSQTMGKIIYWINNIAPIKEIDLSVFLEYNTKISQLPIGAERLSYSKDFLLSEDVKLDQITAKFKKRIIEKCFEIIKHYNMGRN